MERVALRWDLSREEADTYCLVLISAGIESGARPEYGGWAVLVDPEDYDAAHGIIEQYDDENRSGKPETDRISRHSRKTFSALWICIGLTAIFSATGAHNDAVIRRYGSEAFAVLHGEAYRTVTALFIHVDAVHLLGNLTGMAIFGTVVCMITGPGIGWFLILLSGSLGNAVNAGLYETGHLSVGASTAVFGAIGILCGIQFADKFRGSGMRLKAFIAPAAGLALLGFLGSGETTDIMAHCFGYLVGLAVGIAIALGIRRRPSRSYQIAAFILTLAILGLSVAMACDCIRHFSMESLP